MSLDEWLKTVPILALRAFSEDLPNAHDANRTKLERHVLRDSEAARWRAEESMRIEVANLGRPARPVLKHLKQRDVANDPR